jgi:hypothetical protein
LERMHTCCFAYSGSGVYGLTLVELQDLVCGLKIGIIADVHKSVFLDTIAQSRQMPKLHLDYD